MRERDDKMATIDFHDATLETAPFASDAWISPKGRFYPVLDYGHHEMASRLVSRVMETIPTDRHQNRYGAVCEPGCIGKPDEDTLVQTSDGIYLLHDEYIGGPVSLLERNRWWHCSLGNVYADTLSQPQIDTLFDMVMKWREQYGEGHYSYGSRVKSYMRTLDAMMMGKY